MARSGQATINTTSLAREFQLTTKDLEKRLRKLGIVPVSEVIMPSGRRFILWPEAEARKALTDYRDSLRAARDAAFGRVTPPTTQPKPAQDQSVDDLKAEVQDLKAMMSELLRKLGKDK